MSNVTEIELDIDYDKLRKEFEELNIEKFLVENKGQMMIQTMSGTPEEQQALLGTLSLYVDWDNHNPNDPNSVVRGRYMMMNWKSCLTYHNDETPRIHLPLITNDGCFMIIDDKTEKLHESTTYLVDTTKRHTALNAGEHLRFHMVFCLPPVKDGRTKNQLEFDLE